MRTAVRVERLSKVFHHQLPRYNTLIGRLRRLGREWDGPSTWALRDVSFEVAKGECFGVCGPNGAGKSTLLAVLAGILEPTAGRIELCGRTNAFLSLGEGIQPEFSVLDNIETCGILMGLRRREVLRRRDAILDFAELSDRAELRMAELSTGQGARVAFSTAIHSDLDIMLVDETLSVGDAAFQAKCEAAFGRLVKEGKTLLVASHDQDLLQRICARSLRLDRGRGEVSSRSGGGRLRVLFIGNSLTRSSGAADGNGNGRHDLPGLLSALRPGEVEAAAVAEDAQTLQGHWEKGRAREMIQSGRWDFVVLQEESLLPALDASALRRYARLFDAEIRQAGARTVLFAAWTRKIGPDLQPRAAQTYDALAAELGALVAPVGAAWAEALARRPELELYAPDGSHAAPLGGHLAASVFSRVLFGRGPVNAEAAHSASEAALPRDSARSAVPGGCSPEDLRFLDAVARDCVRARATAE